MADDQIVNGGHEVKLISPGVATTAPSVSPVIVSSGSRPLQIATSPGGGNVVDGVALTKTPSTSITVIPAAASATPVSSAAPPSTGVIVIRSATTANVQQQALPTSPSTATGTSIAVSSGITIRSSATATSAAVPTATNDVRANSPPPAVEETTESIVIVSTQTPPSEGVNLLPVNGSSHQEVEDNVSPAETPTVPAPIEEGPAEPPVVTSPLPVIPAVEEAAVVVEESSNPPQSNDVSQSSPDVSSTEPPSTSVLRPPTSICSRSRPASAVYEKPRQPPMTWSELTDRFDLVTVCGFTLAVLAVAFSSILAGEDLPFGYLLAGISAISMGLFVKLHL